MMRPEDRLLNTVVPRGDRQQHRPHRRLIAHVAAGQKGQRAKAHPAAQQVAAVDVLDEGFVLFQRALIDRLFRPKYRLRGGTGRHGHLLQSRQPETGRVSARSSTLTIGPPVSMAMRECGTSSARATCTIRNSTIAVM